MPERRDASGLWIAGYCVLFFAAWALWTLWLRPATVERLPEWTGVWASAAVKLLVWTLPAWLMLRKRRQAMLVPYWFRNRLRWRTVLLWTGLILLYAAFISYVQRGFQVQEAFVPSQLINTVLLVGITEEAVFRGVLLNAMAKRWPSNVALWVSSALFVLIHFPIWYQRGMFADPIQLVGSCISILLLGALFGHRFLQDKNLLSPILLHMAWNLPALLFFG